MDAFLMARKISRPINASKQTDDDKPDLHLDFEKLLTPGERAEIKRKAALKIEARDKEEASARYLKEEMARIDRELHPETEVQMVPFTPQLADFADAIRMEGRTYHHGFTYQVPAHQVAQLLDIQFQTHRHEYEITRGRDSSSFYRRSRDFSINSDGTALSGGRPARF